MTALLRCYNISAISIVDEKIDLSFITLSRNKDTNKVYAISLDGTAAENLMDDLAICVSPAVSIEA